MPLIYANNFRGFQNTYLPLRNVNFFVGENSTGKTSLLRLIRILSDLRFWFSLDFNAEETGLGYFSEITDGKETVFFEIGILGDTVDKSDSDISAIKIKFTDNAGIPSVSEIRMIDSRFDIEIIREKNEVKYRYQPLEVDKYEGNKEKYFKFWIENNTLKDRKFEEIQIEEAEIPPSALIFNIQDFIESEIKNSKKHFRSFRLPQFLREVTWLAPIRAKPKRTYDNYKLDFSPEGSHTPYLLKNLLSKENNDKKQIEKILEKFGLDSGLFEKVEVHSLGKDKTSPFEIWIYLNGRPYKISNVGYGVSQILPLIIEVLASRNGTWFAIQQPEIHLHPRGQAAFGEFIYKTYITEEKNFIIETHSDFTIDRFRLRVNTAYKKEKSYVDKFQVVFFQHSSKGNKLTCIPILPDGTYSENQPKEFKEFFIKEQLELLKI